MKNMCSRTEKQTLLPFQGEAPTATSTQGVALGCALLPFQGEKNHIQTFATKAYDTINYSFPKQASISPLKSCHPYCGHIIRKRLIGNGDNKYLAEGPYRIRHNAGFLKLLQKLFNDSIFVYTII